MSNPALKRKIEPEGEDAAKKRRPSADLPNPDTSEDHSKPIEDSSEAVGEPATEVEKPAGTDAKVDTPSAPAKPKEAPEVVKTPKEEAKAATSRPVFGAASSFGSASVFDKMKSKPSVFDGLPSQKEASQGLAKTPTSSFGSFGSSFGANSSFGDALKKATQKKSFLDEPKDESTPTAETPESTADKSQYKQVSLDQQKVTTGEENEKSVFSATAKMFEMDLSKVSDGWKERGLGPLHLNQSLTQKSDVRLVMRSQGLLRVVLNYRITPATVLMKGLQASMNPGKFVRLSSMSPEGKPVQYLLKFSNESVRNDLVDKVEDLKKEIADGDSGAPAKATGFRFIDAEDADSKNDGSNDGN